MYIGLKRLIIQQQPHLEETDGKKKKNWKT